MRALGTSLWLILSLVSARAGACSAFLVQGSSHALVAKNFDWYSGYGHLMINKRRVSRAASLIDTNHPLTWTSRFASLTFSGSGAGFPWEGMNEAGLSVNSLQLMGSSGLRATETVPTVGYIQWMQYLLDRAANVRQAIRLAKRVRLGSTNLHYLVCDASKKCAAFEFLEGKLVVHTGTDLPYVALTNSPYRDAVAYFERTEPAREPEKTLADLDTDSYVRFSRAALWSTSYREKTESPIDYAFRGLANLSQDIPASPGFYLWKTFWSMVFDLKTKTVYWRTADSPTLHQVNLASFDPHCSSGTEVLALGGTADTFHRLTPSENDSIFDGLVTSLPPTERPAPADVATLKASSRSATCHP